MAATLGELNVIIGANLDAFEAAMNEAQRGIGRLGDKLQSAGQSLTGAITLPLTLLAGAALKSAGDLQALEKGFAATYKGGEQLSVALAKVRELAKLPGLGLKEALQGATNLQAAGFSADLATRALGAFGNALATVGKGKADLDGVGLALGQIAAKGKISQEEINQLQERVPQVGAAIKAAFGTADTKSLTNLGISATQFVEGVTTELAKLPKVTGGINNAFENLEDAGTIALAKLGTSLNNAFNVEGLISRFGDFITGLADKFAALDPAIQKTIFVIAGVAAAAGPVLLAIGAIGAAIPAVTAGFAAFGVTSVAALGPIALAAAAIAAAALLIYDNWDQLRPVFESAADSIGTAFSQISEAVSSLPGAINAVRESLSGLNSGEGFVNLNNGLTITQTLVQDLGVGVKALSDVFGGTIGAVVKLFKGDLGGTIDEAKRALYGLLDPLAAVLGFTKKTTFGDFFKGQFAIAEEAAVKAGAGVDFFADSVINAGGKEPVSAETLKRLQDMADALDKVQQSLRNNDNASLAFGNSLTNVGSKYDYVGERAGILEGAIKSLTEAGFAPGSAEVQRYVQQLNALPMAIEQATTKAAQGLEGLSKVRPEFNVLDSFGDDNNLDTANGKSPYKIPEVLPLLPVDSAALQASLDAAVAYLNDSYARIGAAQQDAILAQEEFNINTEALLQQFPVAGFAAIGEAVGNALGSGGDVLAAAGKALLKVLADFGIKYGQQLIALGVADIATGIFVSKGIGEIAAGTALIAASAALGAIGGGASSSGGGGGSRASAGGAGASSTPRTAFTPTVAPAAQANNTPAVVTHIVEIKAKGADLANTLTIQTDRLGRVLGR